MRDKFVSELIEIAKKDKNTFLITGDLGYGVINKFAENFPNQYLNVGVAEQNMTGLATGMALEGKIVYTYSIANFPSLRCLEQIRNDACYHNANLKIISIGGGFSYGSLGMSHHATEDLAILRALPNIKVIAPGDLVETAAATRAIHNTKGVCYLRLSRGGDKEIHLNNINFKIGKAVKIIDGQEVVIFSIGGILKNAVEAAKILKGMNIDVALYSMHTIKPIDRDLIESLAFSTKLIVTIEEHNVIGGLGSAVAEILATLNNPIARLKMIGLQDCYSSIIGDQEYLRSYYGMSVESIVNACQL